MLWPLIDRWRSPAPDPARVSWLKEWDYAHRGLHSKGVPENSPSAFAEAIERGLGIECDVQRTRDGRAMVFHDWDLDRLTDESGPVNERDAADLEKIVLAGGDGSGETIPELGRMLDQVAGQVPILIEVKSAFDHRTHALCLAVNRVLEGYYGQYAVMSFDPRVSRWFADHAPHIIRGLVVTEEGHKGWLGGWKRHKALWHAKPDFIAYDIRDLPSGFAAGQRKRGLPVLTWTVRTEELRERGIAHADALIAELEEPA